VELASWKEDLCYSVYRKAWHCCCWATFHKEMLELLDKTQAQEELLNRIPPVETLAVLRWVERRGLRRRHQPRKRG
jgi:hypothetical protein